MPPFTTLLTRKRARKRATHHAEPPFPLPTEIINEITAHLNLLDAWHARGINHTFNISCLGHITQRLIPSIKFTLNWFQDATDYRLPTLGLADARLILEPDEFALLQWMVELPFTFESHPPRWAVGEVKMCFTVNRSVEATEAMMCRPHKVWLRPRSRWPGDIFAHSPDPKHVLAIWFDPRDGKVAEGVINRSIKTAKCVVLQDSEIKLVIRLADIVRLVQYTLKYETSRDFIPLEFTFTVDCFPEE